MPFTPINLGTPNVGDGDTLRDGGQIINDNFDVAVEGPLSSTAGNLVVFDDASGRLIRDSAVAESDVEDAVAVTLSPTHTFPSANVVRVALSGSLTNSYTITGEVKLTTNPAGVNEGFVGTANTISGGRAEVTSGTGAATVTNSVSGGRLSIGNVVQGSTTVSRRTVITAFVGGASRTGLHGVAMGQTADTTTVVSRFFSIAVGNAAPAYFEVAVDPALAFDTTRTFLFAVAH